ncbi:hypothetical protein I0P70_20530 [Pontibacter sp. FD36]|nr:hypothetical protein [Pontibacter sp. FD36]MBF8965650.1 hypothetical protein [Pontibacter sp. FD36]
MLQKKAFLGEIGLGEGFFAVKCAVLLGRFANSSTGHDLNGRVIMD